MGTRSSIAIKTEDGTYKGIYCHWDGYLDHNGIILYESYDTYEKVLELVNLGDASSLDHSSKLVEGHTYDTKKEGCSTFYHRDRGEKWEDVAPKEFDTYKELLDYLGQGYDYIFEDGEWYDNGKGKLEDLLINTEHASRVKELKKKRIQTDRKLKIERINED